MITGANGFVGSHMIEFVLADHPEVDAICAVRRSQTSSMRYVSHIHDEKVKWALCDLTDAAGVNKLMREELPDRVFVLHAQSFVPVSFSNPAQTVTNNVVSTINILEAVREFCPTARVHVCSSSEVYGHNENNPTNELEPFAPLSPYAISKVGQDLFGKFYHDAYGLHTVVSRAFTHTGPRRGQEFFESSFARQVAMIEKGLQEPIIRVGNLESRRTIMHVKDCCRGYWELADKGEAGEAYNVGGSELWSVGKVLAFLVNESSRKGGITVDVRPELLRPTDVNIQVPDTTKIWQLCGWKATISVEETLRELLAYWRQNV